MKKYLFLFTLAGLLVSCKQDANQEEEKPPPLALSKILPGTWEIVHLTVTVNSYNNTDSSYVEEIREEQWEKVFFVKPVRTFYELDNKYRRAYLDANEELMSESRGMWNTFNDTLMMIEPDATYQYIVEKQPNGLLKFSGLIDWDSDGQEDDEYVAMQRYISRTTN